MSIGPAFGSTLLTTAFVNLERTLGMPAGGPKTIPLTLDFTSQDVYELDLSNFGARTFIDMIQTVFVDLSTSGVGLTIDIPGSRQTLKIEPGTQGYYPILVPNPIKLSFTCAGGPADVKIELMNFPIPPGVWNPESDLSVEFGPTVSTDVLTTIPASVADALGTSNGYVIIRNVGADSVDVSFLGANRADLTDEIAIFSGAITAGSFVTNVGPLPRYLRVRIISTAPGTPGTITGGYNLS